eukprot:TRINITY_DN3516_c0_g1_i8.p1 TRINITY_DN3516_c0_g1~~TRINITY_DN3516_c0_g1_i8.p1  ORF type:complete len:189 (+),score=-28.86 TRINITY_DN3516_c0_g1_i8:713-1279(+)
MNFLSTTHQFILQQSNSQNKSSQLVKVFVCILLKLQFVQIFTQSILCKHTLNFSVQKITYFKCNSYIDSIFFIENKLIFSHCQTQLCKYSRIFYLNTCQALRLIMDSHEPIKTPLKICRIEISFCLKFQVSQSNYCSPTNIVITNLNIHHNSRSYVSSLNIKLIKCCYLILNSLFIYSEATTKYPYLF